MENDPAETEEDDEVIFLSSDQESQDEEDTTMDSTRNIPEKESQNKDQTTAPQSQQPPVKIKRKRNATTRKSISLNMKLEILDRLKNGEGPTKIARSYGWNESTIRTIKKNESIIRQSVSAGSLLTSRYSSYTRDSIMEAMEQRLLEWIEAHNKRIDEIDINNNNITGNQPNSKEQCNSPVRPLDSAAVRLKAVNIYNELKNERKQAIKQIRNRNGPKYGTKSKTMIHQELDSATDSWNFAASKGWFGNFRRRYSLNSKMRHDPAYAAAAAIVDASESARMGNANRFVGAAGTLTCSVVVPGHDQSSALSSSSRNYLQMNHHHHHHQQHSSSHYRQLSSNNNNNLNPDIEDEFSIKVAKIIQQNACKQLQLQRTGNSFDANESRPKTNLILIGDNNNNCITIEDSKLCKIVQDEGSSSESSSSGDILGDSIGGQPKPKQEDNQFTAENIGSVLQLGITLKKFIIQIDPDRDRANKFCKNLQNCLEPYQEVYGRLAVVNVEDKGDAVLKSKPRTTTSLEFRDNGSMRLQQPNEQEDDGDGDQSSSASLSGLRQSNEPSANNKTSFSDTSFTAANIATTTTTPTFTNPVTVRLKSSKSSDSSSSSSSSSNEPEYILSDRGVAIQVGNRVLRHSTRPGSFVQLKKHPLDDEKFRDMLSSAKAKSALRNRRLKLEIARLIKEDRNILQTEIVKALPDDLKASKSTVHRIIKELDVRRTKKYFVGRNLPR